MRAYVDCAESISLSGSELRPNELTVHAGMRDDAACRSQVGGASAVTDFVVRYGPARTKSIVQLFPVLTALLPEDPIRSCLSY